MKKIAVITMGVRLDNETKGYTRFRFLSEFLVQNGFQVDLITTSFQHWEKKQRNLKECFKVKYPFKLKFIYEPGYNKNIDPKRIFSHHIASKNLKKYLYDKGDYDLIYSEIPPNDVAKEIALYCNHKGIPYIVDVNDLWPEAMKMALDVPIVSDVLFHPFLRDAEKVYSLVSGVIGTSDEYRDRPFKNNNRNIPKDTVYVGNEIEVFDQGTVDNWDKVEKPEGEFWVTYAGTLGASYDIETMIEAQSILQKRGYDNVRTQILGGGPDEEKLHLLADELKANVKFRGYQSYDMMAAYLKKSDILVNSFVKKAPQSIVTKIGDYLAAGKPMINTCSSPEFRNKVEADNFGINIEAENPEILADAIESLLKNEAQREVYGRNARNIAERQFDRKMAYRKIITMIDELLGV